MYNQLEIGLGFVPLGLVPMTARELWLEAPTPSEGIVLFSVLALRNEEIQALSA